MQFKTPLPRHLPASEALPGNRLTEFEGIDLSYDGAGNLSEKKLPDGTHLHFGYDALNRMVSLERHNPDGSTLRARYAYDVFNRRIRKSVSQGQNTMPRVTRYGWDGERMCAEVMDALTRTTIYEPGSHVPLLRIDQEEPTPEPVPNLDLAPGVQRLFAPPRPKPPARIAHYHTDQLGTPLMLTGQEGKVLWRASPDDWAAVCDEKGETDQPIRFQGQQLDKESGLHYNFNRYYDPQMGRYVTQDPIGLEGGINTYAYVAGDPLGYVDPDGRIALPVITGLIGAGASAIGNIIGQMAVSKCKPFSLADLAVAIGGGFVAGAVAPFVPGGALGATTWGGLSNVSQYAAGSAIKGEGMSWSSAAINFGTGVVGGAVGGAVGRTAPWPYGGTAASREMVNASNNAANVRLNTGFSNLLRNLGGGVVGNAPATDICECMAK